jgi:cell division transport system ATP-binding protein
MIRLVDVGKSYPNGTRALKNATFTVADGEFLFITGQSGSGKSTIVRLLTGETRPTEGRVQVGGFNVGTLRAKDIPHLRRTLGVVFQDFRLIESKSIYENLAFVMRAVGAGHREIKERVPYVLNLVGLDKRYRRRPTELSGGEQQRVAVARALVNNPRVILADEPTGNLDPARSYEIMMLLDRINSLGTTVLVVTHEKELVNKLSKRVLTIDGGRIISDKTGGYYSPGAGQTAGEGP